MKIGKEYLYILTDKEKEDFVREFEWSSNAELESYLEDHYCNFHDFIVNAFNFGGDESYWYGIINYYTITLAQEKVKELLQKKNFDESLEHVEALIKTISHYSSKMFWQEVKKQLIKQATEI